MGFIMALISSLFTLLLLSPIANAVTSKLFREYIGAEYKGVHFSDVPVNPKVDFHFLLAFTLDYTDTKHPLPTNGKFNKFWDVGSLTPQEVMSLKRRNHNVRVAISLGGDSIHNQHAYFAPRSISSWVSNAAASLTRIIREYHLDGIDIDYEHFKTDPNTFAECIGRLITLLKQRNVISFTSIAPFDDASVQSHYQELWRRYHRVIDYVNFQFYAYDKGTSVQKFLNYFDRQASNYRGGQILVSFSSDNSGGLKPENGFFSACEQLKKKGKLGGIFVWSADDSKKLDYRNEKRAQQLLVA